MAHIRAAHIKAMLLEHLKIIPQTLNPKPEYDLQAGLRFFESRFQVLDEGR